MQALWLVPIKVILTPTITFDFEGLSRNPFIDKGHFNSSTSELEAMRMGRNPFIDKGHFNGSTRLVPIASIVVTPSSIRSF